MAQIAAGSDPAILLEVDDVIKALRSIDYVNWGGNAYPKSPTGLKTFTAVSSAFTPGATPDDIFTISGATDILMRILRMGIATVQTTAGVNAWFIRKRSTLNSGGTSAAVTIVPHDSDDASPNASVLQYTVDPTLGTLVGDVWGGRINSPAVATAGIGGLVGAAVDFTEIYGKPILLKTANQQLGWCFNNAALPAGLSVIAYVTWTEEPLL